MSRIFNCRCRLRERLLSIILSRGRRFDGVFGSLLNEFDKTLEGPITIIINEVARTSGFEFDGGESRDLERNRGGEVILSGFHLGTKRANVN